eukprot:COSAG03_NODE_7381_length_926_cov_1.053204_1_plen_126_part_10
MRDRPGRGSGPIVRHATVSGFGPRNTVCADSAPEPCERTNASAPGAWGASPSSAVMSVSASLRGMQVMALHELATAEAPADAVEDAMDAEDPKSALVELLLRQRDAAAGSAVGSSAEAAPEAAELA